LQPNIQQQHILVLAPCMLGIEASHPDPACTPILQAKRSQGCCHCECSSWMSLLKRKPRQGSSVHLRTIVACCVPICSSGGCIRVQCSMWQGCPPHLGWPDWLSMMIAFRRH